MKKKLCPQCKKEKLIRFFNVKKMDKKKFGEICYHCYRKLTNQNFNKLYEYEKLVESTCPKCRKKHMASAKWKYCYACLCTLELQGAMKYLTNQE